ncbi:ligase-associated DNA damage response endonuclease PdeM [Spiribacter onubensis]|uniref:Ligase-associated DNA damage response endonuclease PdeM n=1 Tax=Spiribacter onubensis TaxID=3122420 RepID=A0ABV3S6B3_9GAMM
MSEQTLQIGRHTLQLLPERAVYWPALSALLLADLHLGKAAAFRRAGLAIPEGDTAASLQRLDALITNWQPREIILLGDILHVRLGSDPALHRQILDWRVRHGAITMTAIIGNHDRELRRLEPALDCYEEGIERSGVVLRHHPPEGGIDRPWIAGHWHPVVRLDAGGDSLRLPAFIQESGDGLILPAFGGMTGGAPVTARRGRSRYVTSGEAVLAVDAYQPAD